jgi:hypothetical protein
MVVKLKAPLLNLPRALGFYPEDVDINSFFQKFGNDLPDYTVSHPRRQ